MPSPTTLSKFMDDSFVPPNYRVSRIKLCTKSVPRSKLHSAALLGDVNKVKALLRKGADVNGKGDYGRTPLHYAVCAKHVEIVSILIEKGADVNASFERATPVACATEIGCLEILKILVENGADFQAVNCDNLTPLHDASFNGFIDLVTFLIEKGVDVNVSSTIPRKPGVTPLHLAVSNGHLEVAKLLIGKQANVNAGATFINDEKKLEESVSPLLLAVLKGHLEIAKMLIEAGADINAQSSSKITSLHAACLTDDVKLALILLNSDKCNANCRDAQGTTPLHIASQKGLFDVVQGLLKFKGIDVNYMSPRLGTPLHQASSRGHIKIVELLLVNGAKNNSKTSEGYSPLLAAVARGHLKVSEFLVERGANISPHGRVSSPYLYHACFHSTFIDFIKRLVGMGANVNAEEEGGWRPLHVASREKHESIVRYLVEVGAIIDVKSDCGSSPLYCALLSNSIELVKFFVLKGADVNLGNDGKMLPIHIAAMIGDPLIVELLLTKGAFFDSPISASSESPSDYARFNGSQKVFCTFALIEKFFRAANRSDNRLLLRCIKGGVIINAKSASGRTPLSLTISNCNVEGTKLLLKHQADIDYNTKSGITLIHVAALWGDAKITEVLLRHVKQLGCVKFEDFLNARTHLGRTALHKAAERNKIDVVKVLLKHGAEYNVLDEDLNYPSDLATADAVRRIFNDVERFFDSFKEYGDRNVLDLSDLNKSCMNAKDLKTNSTLLHLSLQGGHVDNAIFMIKNGADCCLVGEDGKSPLHIASSKGNSEIVKILLAQVKNDNPSSLISFIDTITSSKGSSALHMTQSVRVAKVLLRNGATHDLRNKDGLTPFETSKSRSVRGLLTLVRELFQAAENGDPKIVKELKLLDTDDVATVTCARDCLGRTLTQILRTENKLIANDVIKIMDL